MVMISLERLELQEKTNVKQKSDLQNEQVIQELAHQEEYRNPNVTVDAFSPLHVRLAAEKPILFECLQKLREEIGEEAYQNYFSTLKTINRSGKKLLIVGDNLFQRSMIERDYIPAIKKAFEVTFVRITV